MREVVKRRVATVRWSTSSHFARISEESSICGAPDPAWPGKVDRIVFEAFSIDNLSTPEILELVKCKTCRNLFEKSSRARESCTHTKKFTVKR